MPPYKVHRATVLRVSDSAAPSRLFLDCRRTVSVPVEADVERWRATFQPHRVTCKRCLRKSATAGVVTRTS